MKPDTLVGAIFGTAHAEKEALGSYHKAHNWVGRIDKDAESVSKL